MHKVAVSRRRRESARPSAPDTDYRESHTSSQQALWYEFETYAPDSYDSWLWGQEKDYLDDIIDRYVSDRPVRYLDFACGSGRIISFLEGRVTDATGVDVSPSMLKLARAKLKRSRLVLRDPTLQPMLLMGPYDLITAFRFFLNAQDQLRDEALAAIASLMDRKATFIFNIHGNKASLRFPSIAVRRYVLRQRHLRQLSFWQMKRKLEAHGLEIVEVHGYGFLTRKVFGWLGPRACMKVDRACGHNLLKYFASNLLVVCRKTAD